MEKIVNLAIGIAFLAGTGVASADELFESEIIGIPTAQQVVRGVSGGLLPWVSSGEAELE